MKRNVNLPLVPIRPGALLCFETNDIDCNALLK